MDIGRSRPGRLFFLEHASKGVGRKVSWGWGATEENKTEK